jgi:hypothetical protein
MTTEDLNQFIRATFPEWGPDPRGTLGIYPGHPIPGHGDDDVGSIEVLFAVDGEQLEVYRLGEAGQREETIFIAPLATASFEDLKKTLDIALD